MEKKEKDKVTKEQINHLKSELMKKDIPELMIVSLLGLEIKDISIADYNILLYILKSNEI